MTGGARAAFSQAVKAVPLGFSREGLEEDRQQGRKSFLCGRMRKDGQVGQDAETASFHLSSRLVSANFPPGFFSHVFIDECGHAVEPESVVAIAGKQGPAAVSRSSISACPGVPPIPH